MNIYLTMSIQVKDSSMFMIVSPSSLLLFYVTLFNRTGKKKERER